MTNHSNVTVSSESLLNTEKEMMLLFLCFCFVLLLDKDGHSNQVFNYHESTDHQITQWKTVIDINTYNCNGSILCQPSPYRYAVSFYCCWSFFLKRFYNLFLRKSMVVRSSQVQSQIQWSFSRYLNECCIHAQRFA